MGTASQRNLELEAAAFADYDDIDSWRVYADWLQSVGDGRGEIASLAVQGREAFLSQRRSMAARMRELERPYIDAWHTWAQDNDLLDVSVVFKRGFAHAVEGPLSQLRTKIDEMFERDPIQRLTLTELDSDELARLCERAPPWLARLEYLKLSGDLDESATAGLASIALTRLRRLNLLGCNIDDDACTHLANLRTERLEHLTLTANAIGDAGLGALLTSPTRGQWHELYLSGNPITKAGVARLASTPGFDALTGLFMRQIEARFDAFAVFMEPTAIPTLTQLELPSSGSWQHRDVRDRLRERFGRHLLLC